MTKGRNFSFDTFYICCENSKSVKVQVAMSSLAATQADGYYVPPEYFESGQYKKKSKNQFAGSKGHNQYLQKGVVRFELPYKGVCEKCMVSVGRGTRYNAQKVNSGESYFTTPIWEFQMTCRNCQHPWKIRTNPQERGFDYVEGVSIQAGQDDIVDMTSLSTTTTGGDQIVASSLDRLESVARGERQNKSTIEKLQALQTLQSRTTLEDASWNASIRATFRGDRKLKRLKKQQASKAGWRDGMEWLNLSTEDQLAAKAAVYGKAQKNELRGWRDVRKSSIFDASSSRKRTRRVPLRSSIEPPSPVSSMVCNDDTEKKANVTGKQEATVQAAPRGKQRIQITATGVAASRSATASDKQESAPTYNAIQDMLAKYGSSSDSDNDQ